MLCNTNARDDYFYTHKLPYCVRRDICNLLDADQSWRTLGGQFVGLDATQLKLLGQAYMRNGSPTEELFNKLDSANLQTTQLCFYLEQMSHWRALEILRPFVSAADTAQSSNNNSAFEFRHRELRGDGSSFANEIGDESVAMLMSSNTLYTPTPSFSDSLVRPAALENGDNGFDEALPNGQNLAALVEVRPRQHVDNSATCNEQQQQQPLPPTRCHKSGATNAAHHNQHQDSNQADELGRQKAQANKQKQKRTSISDQEVVNQLKLIMQTTYNELKQASNNFAESNILGNGAFASVYRGYWKGTDVAIKRLRCNLIDQALNELSTLNSYRIDNILPIYGISLDGPEACLVYQFMSNGSLEDRLSCKNQTKPLSWNQRALIGEGIAKGLYYLHTLRDKPLVHGDIKSANVLLDAQFVPKLGDFGLARQVFRGKNPQTELATHCTVSSIHGTSVYLPPEYLRHKILSPAVDVYSYAIVLLEMATGKRAYDGKRLLIDFVEEETSGQKSMAEIACKLKDARLVGDTSRLGFQIWLELLVRLGLACAHKIKKKRPDMGQVLNHFVEFRKNADSNSDEQKQSVVAATSQQKLDEQQMPFSGTSANGALAAAAPAPSATTRTLTPEMSATHHQAAEQRVQRRATPPAPLLVDTQDLFAKHTATGAADQRDLSLMSVEELVEPENFNGEMVVLNESQLEWLDNIGGGEGLGQKVLPQSAQPAQVGAAQEVCGPVEAMIPLLTELGIVCEQSQQGD